MMRLTLPNGCFVVQYIGINRINMRDQYLSQEVVGT